MSRTLKDDDIAAILLKESDSFAERLKWSRLKLKIIRRLNTENQILNHLRMMHYQEQQHFISETIGNQNGINHHRRSMSEQRL